MPLHLPADFVHQFEEKSPFGSAGTAVAMAFAANSRLLALGGSDLPLAGPDPLCAPLLSTFPPKLDAACPSCCPSSPNFTPSWAIPDGTALNESPRSHPDFVMMRSRREDSRPTRVPRRNSGAHALV
jgi:hypothetical protein